MQAKNYPVNHHHLCNYKYLKSIAMFNSVALDVVIGLVFIYLLYSLLVTVLSELVAIVLNLRAKNLKEAIDRMLNDEKDMSTGQRLVDTLKLTKNPDNPVVNAFYNHPEIKYLGSSGIYKIPSNFKAGSFSKTLISLLFGENKATRAIIDGKISKLTVTGPDKNNKKVTTTIDPETAAYIRSLWIDAQGDVEKFKLLIESWFERTMEHTIEWYKRKIRVVTILLGFFLAWFFNADTFFIVKGLSKDRDARDKLVSMANAYIESNQYSATTAKLETAKAAADTKIKLDTVLAITSQLQSDIAKANNILGIGCFLPDSVQIIKGPSGKLTSSPLIESAFLITKRGEVKENKDFKYYKPCDKLYYFFWLFWHHFFGFLVTAIAISLGAPFWFDILSKVMALRTSKKEPVTSPQGKTTNSTVPPVNPVG
jgi:hypothetical protein